jgi:hypothetical protein
MCDAPRQMAYTYFNPRFDGKCSPEAARWVVNLDTTNFIKALDCFTMAVRKSVRKGEGVINAAVRRSGVDGGTATAASLRYLTTMNAFAVAVSAAKGNLLRTGPYQNSAAVAEPASYALFIQCVWEANGMQGVRTITGNQGQAPEQSSATTTTQGSLGNKSVDRITNHQLESVETKKAYEAERLIIFCPYNAVHWWICRPTIFDTIHANNSEQVQAMLSGMVRAVERVMFEEAGLHQYEQTTPQREGATHQPREFTAHNHEGQQPRQRPAQNREGPMLATLHAATTRQLRPLTVMLLQAFVTVYNYERRTNANELIYLLDLPKDTNIDDIYRIHKETTEELVLGCNAKHSKRAQVRYRQGTRRRAIQNAWPAGVHKRTSLAAAFTAGEDPPEWLSGSAPFTAGEDPPEWLSGSAPFTAGEDPPERISGSARSITPDNTVTSISQLTPDPPLAGWDGGGALEGPWHWVDQKSPPKTASRLSPSPHKRKRHQPHRSPSRYPPRTPSSQSSDSNAVCLTPSPGRSDRYRHAPATPPRTQSSQSSDVTSLTQTHTPSPQSSNTTPARQIPKGEQMALLAVVDLDEIGKLLDILPRIHKDTAALKKIHNEKGYSWMVSYFFGNDSTFGRLYSGASGIQSMAKRIRAILTHRLLYDLDIVNCFPTVLSQIFRYNKIPCDALDAYVRDRDSILKQLTKNSTMTRDKAKNLFLRMTHGGNIYTAIQDAHR